MIHLKEFMGKLFCVLHELAWKLQDFLTDNMTNSLLATVPAGADTHTDD